MSDATHDASSRRSVLLVLFLGVLMAALDIAIVGPALPALREAFGLSKRAAAWVFNAFVLCNLMSVALMARLADVFGRRLIYTMCVLLFGAGAAIVASAASFTVLLVGRGVQGLAAAGIFPAASAVVGDTFPPARQGRALGILGAVYGLAFLVGPMVAGILLGVAHWPWLFGLNVPLAAIIALLAWRVLPRRTRARTDRPLDALGIALLGAMLFALAYAINQVDTAAVGQSLWAWEVGPLVIGAGLLLGGFVWHERRAADPLFRLELFANRQVRIASALSFGAGCTEAAFIFFPDLAVAAFDVTGSTASFMLMPLVGAVALGAPVAGRLLDRLGARRIVVSGAASMAAGLAAIGSWPAAQAAFYGGSVLIGLGLAALLGSSLSYILLAETEAAERTVGQGLNSLCLGIGQLFGGAFIGAVAASATQAITGYANAFLALAAIVGGLTLYALRLRRRVAMDSGG